MSHRRAGRDGSSAQTPSTREREARRQQWLLRVLFGAVDDAPAADWLRPRRQVARGLVAYRAHAAALAERALAAAYPTLRQLVGDESFGALARDFWRCHPPTAGDIALWGDALPAFVAAAPSLADEPSLADVARLEWAVHEAAGAADAEAPHDLGLLGCADPEVLRLQLAPGTALVSSRHPVVTIWQAHRSLAADRFDAVRAAYAVGAGEHALVARVGWKVEVLALAAGDARCTAALLCGRSLAEALRAAGEAFDFAAWLIATLRRQGLSRVSCDGAAA